MIRGLSVFGFVWSLSFLIFDSYAAVTINQGSGWVAFDAFFALFQAVACVCFVYMAIDG